VPFALCQINGQNRKCIAFWLHLWVTEQCTSCILTGNDLFVTVSEAVCYMWNYLQNKDFPMNLHSTKRHLKHPTNVEHTENVQSSNVVECNCKLRDIRKQDMMGMWVHTSVFFRRRRRKRKFSIDENKLIFITKTMTTTKMQQFSLMRRKFQSRILA